MVNLPITCEATRPPHPRRPRFASRGQALIVAVLVMFILAGLAGVFIALINYTMVQAASAEERAKLEEIVQAGLEAAKTELLYSTDGPDWRPDRGPDPANPGWIDYNGGFYHLQVTYGPSTEITAANPFLANPLDRYIRIDVDAKFVLDNPPDPTLKDNDSTKFQVYSKGFLSPRRFLERRLTAYMPIGLTDYARWFTNSSGAQDPVVLGTNLNTGPIATVNQNPDYLSNTALNNSTFATTASATIMDVIEGPVRSEAPVQLGATRIDLTNLPDGASDPYATQFCVKRRDLVEVVEKLTAYDNAVAAHALMVNAQDRSITAQMSPTEAAKAFDAVNVANSATVMRYLQTTQNNPIMRRMRSPRIDARHPVTGISRYKALTAYSGEWLATSATNTTMYNTGQYGQGEGVYINNGEQIQYGHDLAQLRENWLDGSAENWDAGIYRPDQYAVELTLHDYTYASAQIVQLPYIELRDRTGSKRFYNPATKLYQNRITMPYPRNGVIYAEGNLIVKGSVPASIALTGPDANGYYQPATDPHLNGGNTQLPGGWWWDYGNDRAVEKKRRDHQDYYLSPTNRRYDLTVVSGGTVYIEGNLLGPATRHETYKNSTSVSPITRGSAYDSKLGLLAMDNVCLNPTAYMALDTTLLYNNDGHEQYYWAFNQNPITFTFSTAGPIRPRTSILLRHAGQWSNANDSAVIRMRVNDLDYPWYTGPLGGYGYDPHDLFFCLLTNLPLLFPGLSTEQWGGGLYGNNIDPFNTQTWPLIDTQPPIDPPHFTGILNSANQQTPLEGYGATNTIEIRWQPGPRSTTPYLLIADPFQAGPLVNGIDLQVDALIYAQRGSWFIIPGKYYNDGSKISATPLRPIPWKNEPLDVHITINGAIVENRPAPPEAVDAWTQHWRGANIDYYDANGDGVPDQMDPGSDAGSWDTATWRWTKRRIGIVYQYDATLARPVCYDLYPNDDHLYYRSRLPKLPASPDIISLSEMKNI